MKSILTVGINVSKEKLDICFFDEMAFVLKVFENAK
jgi:hypothetical protein